MPVDDEFDYASERAWEGQDDEYEIGRRNMILKVKTCYEALVKGKRLTLEEPEELRQLFDNIELDLRLLREAESDIKNAVRWARECEPEYPWKDHTASEVSWALGSAYRGCDLAVGDWQRTVQQLIADGFVTLPQVMECADKARKLHDAKTKDTR